MSMSDDQPQAPDPRPGHYYVSMVRSGKGPGLVSGPYASHEAALADVELLREVVYMIAPETWFDAWGTCRIEYHQGAAPALGRLQALGLRPVPGPS